MDFLVAPITSSVTPASSPSRSRKDPMSSREARSEKMVYDPSLSTESYTFAAAITSGSSGVPELNRYSSVKSAFDTEVVIVTSPAPLKLMSSIVS